MAKSDRPLP